MAFGEAAGACGRGKFIGEFSKSFSKRQCHCTIVPSDKIYRVNRSVRSQSVAEKDRESAIGGRRDCSYVMALRPYGTKLAAAAEVSVTSA
jgi:hypothetical protein